MTADPRARAGDGEAFRELAESRRRERQVHLLPDARVLGIYQMIARCGRQAGVDAWTHRFRHHFSHTWLDRGGPEGDLMELNG